MHSTVDQEHTVRSRSNQVAQMPPPYIWTPTLWKPLLRMSLVGLSFGHGESVRANAQVHNDNPHNGAPRHAHKTRISANVRCGQPPVLHFLMGLPLPSLLDERGLRTVPQIRCHGASGSPAPYRCGKACLSPWLHTYYSTRWQRLCISLR